MPSAESGLAVGDEIVVAGQAGLKDGVKVRRAGDKPAADPPAEDGGEAES